MDTSYCVKCRRKTKNINLKGFVTKYLVKCTCNVCKSKNQNLFQNRMPLVFYKIYFQKYLF